jgi:hypothetical protein
MLFSRAGGQSGYVGSWDTDVTDGGSEMTAYALGYGEEEYCPLTGHVIAWLAGHAGA